jgi:hypothetical protein
VSYSKENKENEKYKNSVQAEPIAVGSSRPKSRLLIKSNKEKKIKFSILIKKWQTN